MTDRRRRHAIIADLLTRASVASQDELQALLCDRGVDVAQATLSRDLRAMGVVKAPDGYVLPGHLNGHGPAAIDLDEIVSAYVLDAQIGGNLLILRTGPGHAQIVALEIDRSNLPGVLGTIAGDDTIFVAADSGRRAIALRDRLLQGAAT
ncbi:MAG: ArgR family transcriptional regulator [Phycisphaeraceae bacterium]|nr:ArgR family transcriptional regulator [Phycisphaeraceae bacterium]